MLITLREGSVPGITGWVKKEFINGCYWLSQRNTAASQPLLELKSCQGHASSVLTRLQLISLACS